MLRIEFHPTAQKELLKIPKKFRLQIIKRIEELERLNHPLQHPKVRKLRNGKFEQFRLRSGNYRIKFILANSHTIKIAHVQHRQVGY